VLPSGDLTISEDGTNFKVAVEYRANDDALLYANWSEGFRLGLTQDNTALFLFFGGFCDVNPQDGLIDGTNLPFNNRTDLKSDNLDTFEVGAKVSSSNGRWNLHAAAFRTDWDNIPVTVVVPVSGLGCSSTFNGGEARSQGIEVESTFLATENLQFDIAISYVDTEFLDDLAGKQGQQLPFAPENSASVGVQYSFDLANRESYVRADWSYVDESLTSLGAPDVVTTDSYSKLDMRAGIRFERFDLAIFGSNLTDENALVGVFNLDRGWRLRPRTIGIEASILF
jgi:outer membrane receptor protein involved in Fe transport